jgi:polysaccharide biosynthesis protein PslF
MSVRTVTPIGSMSLRIGLLSTYPPNQCGLATFAAAIERALIARGDRVSVVEVSDGQGRTRTGARRTPVLHPGSAASARIVALALSLNDVAVVQHEYGIYGGPDGADVLDVLRALTVPAVVVLHTVPAEPTPTQRQVLEAVCALADRVVVMTQAAAHRLLSTFAVDPTTVAVIPHGASTELSEAPVRSFSGPRTELLTWGLIGPGKGIEHMIHALSLLEDVRPKIRYTIAGATHPKVLARDGDRYRQGLMRSAWSSGVAANVCFDDTYRDVPELTHLLASAAIVVLPYDSPDQATSGVLVDAIAAGKPVIATAFPHAVELLSDGAGIVVPHGDAVALAVAVRAAIEHPESLRRMAARARELAPSLGWAAVADQYHDLCLERTGLRPKVAG